MLLGKFLVECSDLWTFRQPIFYVDPQTHHTILLFNNAGNSNYIIRSSIYEPYPLTLKGFALPENDVARPTIEPKERMMNTDDNLRPLPWEFDAFQIGFGQNLLKRAATASFQREEADELLNSLRDDVEIGGAQGLLSLIRALIARAKPTREALLREGTAICGPAMSELFEELLDDFEGPDPIRDMWHVDSGGHYRVTSVIESRAMSHALDYDPKAPATEW